MNAPQLIECLQNPAALAAVDREELNQLITSHPWFGAAHLLAAIHQQMNPVDAQAQTGKALLYTPHPLWLQYQLNQYTELKEEMVSTAPATKANMTELNQPIQPVAIETDEQEAAIDAQVLVDAVNEQEVMALLEESEKAADAELLVEAVNEQEALALLEEADIATNAEVLKEAVDAAELPEGFKPLSSILQQELPADAALSFEPLHTVDYFASQGIRLKEERIGNDKLGQQLKTFTQWLKELKKVNPADDMPLDAGKEKQVVQMAGSSNLEEEIITESMAKVLEQQGKTQKAAELYHKLSLLHPEKSAYFATQIQRLNQ
ncbi:MAG TPA: hypothetical protein VFV46_09600 [Lacibacter sp.]|nr:hypothetical protein [Lacibacter sp.]